VERHVVGVVRLAPELGEAEVVADVSVREEDPVDERRPRPRRLPRRRFSLGAVDLLAEVG